MRLKDGVILDEVETLGELKFSAMRREKHVLDEKNKPTSEIIERTYDLRSKEQGMMVQISVPGNVAVKNFPFKAEVKLVNPIFGTVTNADFMGTETDWYCKAEDIVLVNRQANPVGGGKPNNQQNQPQEKDKTA